MVYCMMISKKYIFPWATPGRRRGYLDLIRPRQCQRLLSTTSTWDVKSRMTIDEYAVKARTPVGLKTLIDTGYGRLLEDHSEFGQNFEIDDKQRLRLTLRQIASFLRRELPVRFAHRARELVKAPYGLGSMPSIKEVKDWYEESWKEIVYFDEDPWLHTDAGNEKFRHILEGIYSRHQDTLIMIAKGLYEFQNSSMGKSILLPGQDISDFPTIHSYLDRFFLSRIGIRILIGHYLELHSQDTPENYVGIVCMKTSAVEVARSAAEDARYMCERTYGDAPDVEFLGRVDLTFPYIPSHLYYILFELLKNSMRATVEEHGLEDMPAIRVVIADGESNEDVVLRISDQGGGIPRSISEKVFSYLFTTAHEAFPFVGSENLEDFGRENPLAGLGYGLPISRGYARYFQGDLQLMSMHGYGTDAFLHLPRLADTSKSFV